MAGISLSSLVGDRLRPADGAQIAGSWTTGDEIEYLEGLGTHSQASRGLSRLELLRLYRSSMELRDRWGRVDPLIVATEVDVMIRREEMMRGTNGGPDAA